jgi:hypothetical protein
VWIADATRIGIDFQQISVTDFGLVTDDDLFRPLGGLEFRLAKLDPQLIRALRLVEMPPPDS